MLIERVEYRNVLCITAVTIYIAVDFTTLTFDILMEEYLYVEFFSDFNNLT